ncbi:MAG: hypothetical protein WC732_08940 [Candidatus Omnitrophota bacterium]
MTGLLRNLLLIFFVSTLIKLIPALTLPVYSSDAGTYLDMARNLLEGRGLVCSYNVYQFWPGPYYPGWPFMQPLFPLLIAVIWFFTPSLHAVSLANVFLSGINVLLLYAIVMRLYDDSKVAFWSALLASVMWPMRLTSVQPWTEQMHLLFLLLAILVLMRAAGSSSPPGKIQKWHFFAAGVLIASSVLVRVSGVFVLFLWPVAWFFCEGAGRQTWKKTLWFLAGFSAVFIPYEIFCFWRFHLFYPEYPQAAKDFTIAAQSGCFYDFLKPVLRVPSVFAPHFSWRSLSVMAGHVLKFGETLRQDWPLLLIVVLAFKSVKVLRERKGGEVLLWLTAVGHVLFFSLSFWWLDPRRLEAHRYLLVPLTLLMPLAVKGLWDVRDILKEPFSRKYAKLYFPAAVVSLFAFFVIPAWHGSRPWAEFLFRKNPRVVVLQQTADWLKSRTTKEDLVATTQYQEAYVLERPIVSLPEGQALTHENLKRFFEVYKPAYIWISLKRCSHYLEPLKDHARRVELPAALAAHYAVFRLSDKP